MIYLVTYALSFTLVFLLASVRAGFLSSPELGDEGAFILNYLHWTSGDIHGDPYGLKTDDYVRSPFIILALWPFVQLFGEGHGIRVAMSLAASAITPAFIYYGRTLISLRESPHRYNLYLLVGVALLIPLGQPTYAYIGAAYAVLAIALGALHRQSYGLIALAGVVLPHLSPPVTILAATYFIAHYLYMRGTLRPYLCLLYTSPSPRD